MLTPVDISNRVFKGGIGYDKKDVETFISQLSSDYKDLYSSNIELKDKIATLNESLQHYRSIEDSMQKALTLSEKTAEETVNAANDKARQITNEAEIKAEAILVNAKAELQSTKDEIFLLQQQFKTFKQQFNKILNMQKKIMDSEMVGINLGDDYEPSAEVYGGYFGNFGNDSGLGGLGGGLGSGTYVGSNDNSGRERANQEPAFDRGSSLNMDPFADAANGGRFSRQTGGAYNGSKKNANKSGTGEGLNMKNANYNKVKRPVAANVTNNPVASSTDTQQATNPSSVTKDDMLEAINAVKQAVEQSANTTKETPAKESAKNTDYVLYTEEESAKKSSTSAETKAVPKPEPVVKTQPAPQPTPVTETKAVPRPEPVVETQPAPQPTLVTETKAVPRPEPVVETQPAPQPTPVTETKAATQPESVVQVTPVPQSEPIVEPQTRATSNPTAVENTESTLSGEVEDRANESHMLDSEDNHETGFDFITEDTSANSVDNSIVAEEETYSGEIEDKVNESHMLDSEDNHETGFDFIMDAAATSSVDGSMEEETYSGEVEDKVNESHMLDSEDNYDDNEFNFIVDDSVEEEIPTIFTSTVNMDSFNTNTTNEDDDILVGDVEDIAKPSNLIGNNDDESEGFNFI